MQRKRALIDNEISKGKISVVSNQINGKKERFRKVDKTGEINDADILSNIARKISQALTINQLKILQGLVDSKLVLITIQVRWQYTLTRR